MEVQYACFNEFPDQCVGCPEYTEVRQDQRSELALLASLGTFVPPQFTGKIVKECKRYHKRTVEYIK
ncbi:MAG: hypothetical protein ABSG33_11465 [Candidatus Bathyarchaeia archaeon]